MKAEANLDFTGRRFLVTGGANGIGRATIVRFLSGGASVACLDNNAAALEAIASKAGERLLPIHVDVTDTVALDAAVEKAAETLDGLDGVVNAAGVDLLVGLETMDDAAWERLIAVNLTGPMKVCRAAVAHLRQAGGGTIVNLSSGAGLRPLENRSAYSASKAGLQMFSKALALELSGSDIRVNVVCPGAVDTPLFRSGIAGGEEGEKELQAIRARYALARIAEPDEIAAGVAWLSSPESSYVTGVILAIDGGRTFH